MVDFRPVAYVIGRILIVLAILMLAPAIIDWRAGLDNGHAFLASAALTGVTCAALTLSTGNALGRALDTRQAYLLTAGIWFLVPFFGALPFWIGAPGLSLQYAYFEAVSGITTTGATVIFDLDELPAGMNLWRGMLNWLGGLGIAFIAMIFLPLMRVGGMQFFRTEGFDTFGKALPRATDIAQQLLVVYVGLTLICIATYAAIGMTPLDAVVNGFATIATGGFSPADASFSKYQGSGEYVGSLFMYLAALPYVRYVQLVNGVATPLWRDAQARALLRWLLYAVVAVTIWRVATTGDDLERSFREALFNLTSIMTGTGFFSGSFAGWGGLIALTAEDFEYTDNQMLFRLIRESVEQDRTEHHDFVVDALPESLQARSQELAKGAEKQERADEKLLEELLRGVIKLRRVAAGENLNQLRFLQEEAHQNGNLRASPYQDLVLQHARLLRDLDQAHRKMAIKRLE